MDSHLFRILAAELTRMLEGARLEKIHGPRPDILVFTVFVGGRKRRLVLRFGRQSPLLFFSEQVPANPLVPSAPVMRLRKYCAGGRMGRARSDHVSRRIVFPVTGAPGREPYFLLLDMERGACVLREPPENFAQPPVMPGREIIEALCRRTWDKKEKQGPWREFPVLTPLLRETLSFLEPLEGLALTADLERGGGDLFLYADAGGRPAFFSAWPLPDAQARRRGLFPFALTSAPGDPEFGLCPEQARGGRGGPGIPGAEEEAPPLIPATASVAFLLPAYPSLAGVSLVAEPRFFADLGGDERRRHEKPAAAARKKQEKLAAKLREEERRLQGMADLGATAEAIKAVLWRCPADAAPAELELPAADGSGEGRRIALDPRFSLRENMGRMFRQAARGKRGLAMLRLRRNGRSGTEEDGPGKTFGAQEGGKDAYTLSFGRRTEDVAGNAGARARSSRADGREPDQAGDTASDGRACSSRADGRMSGDPGRARLLPPRADGRELRGIARFHSSDGFLLLRGRNAAGNDLLLKSGAAHDYWLHTETLPGAHVLVRRSHAAEEVPERTLCEAAALAAEKSAAQGKATVMVALLRHVRRNAKGAPGAVTITSVLRRVDVDDAGNDPA
jgi:hypothetical protein